MVSLVHVYVSGWWTPCGAHVCRATSTDGVLVRHRMPPLASTVGGGMTSEKLTRAALHAPPKRERAVVVVASSQAPTRE